MSKFHINSKGEPGACRATKQCPFGGAEDHYESAAAAREAQEKKEASRTLPAASRKRKTPPGKQGLLKFSELRYIDYNAQLRAHDGLSTYVNPNATEEEKKAVAVRKEIRDEMEANYRLEHDRLLKVFSHPTSQESAETLLTSGKVNSNSLVPDAVSKGKYDTLARQVATADAATKKAFYKLPTSYHAALFSNVPHRNYASAPFKELVKLSSELHAHDPSWKPNERSVVPRRVEVHSYGSRPGRRVGEAKDMQHVAPATYAILEEGAKLRVGVARADEFWRTVQSDSVNKPKLTDYFKALKNFK